MKRLGDKNRTVTPVDKQGKEFHAKAVLLSSLGMIVVGCGDNTTPVINIVGDTAVKKVCSTKVRLDGTQRSLKVGDSIKIGENAELKVVKIDGNKVTFEGYEGRHKRIDVEMSVGEQKTIRAGEQTVTLVVCSIDEKNGYATVEADKPIMDLNSVNANY